MKLIKQTSSPEDFLICLKHKETSEEVFIEQSEFITMVTEITKDLLVEHVNKTIEGHKRSLMNLHKVRASSPILKEALLKAFPDMNGRPYFTINGRRIDIGDIE